MAVPLLHINPHLSDAQICHLFLQYSFARARLNEVQSEPQAKD